MVNRPQLKYSLRNTNFDQPSLSDWDIMQPSVASVRSAIETTKELAGANQSSDTSQLATSTPLKQVASSTSSKQPQMDKVEWANLHVSAKKQKKPDEVNKIGSMEEIKQVACVEQEFYETLQADLSSIELTLQKDSYSSYYDESYASAIGALFGLDRILNSKVERSEGGKWRLEERESLRVALNRTLASVLAFWQSSLSKLVEEQSLLLRQESALGLGSSTTLKDKREQVLSRKLLVSRLSELKSRLLVGEQELIKMTNKLKRLNQLSDPGDFRAALCGCLAARAGKWAMMSVNELLEKRDLAKLLTDLKAARARGETIGRDVATFCSRWHADFIRTIALKYGHSVKKFVKSFLSVNKSFISEQQEDGANGDGFELVRVIWRLTSRWFPRLNNWLQERIGHFLEARSTSKSSLSSQRGHKLKKRASEQKDQSAAKGHLFDDANRNVFSTPFDSATLYADLDSTSDDFSDFSHFSHLSHLPIFNNYPLPVSLQQSNLALQNVILGKRKKRHTTNETLQLNSEQKKLLKRHVSLGLECSRDGFQQLLQVAEHERQFLFGPNQIDVRGQYMSQLRDSFLLSFESSWLENTRVQAREFAALDLLLTDEANSTTNNNEQWQLSVEQEREKSDQLLAADSYERGLSLGFHLGYFVGKKASTLWPDPTKLNTFAYDSIFVDYELDLEQTRALEWQIVNEATKRIAFLEASREAFLAALKVTFHNGAFLVPQWGLYHAQRATSLRGSQIGAKIGYESAAKAIVSFAPEAMQFFELHKLQRELSQNASASKTSSTSQDDALSPAIEKQLISLNLEQELSERLTQMATDCGSKSGLLMGALVGLLMPAQAFAAFSKSRGSLEGLEQEFNKLKLGAERGFELGNLESQLVDEPKCMFDLDSNDYALSEAKRIGHFSIKEQVERAENVLTYVIENYPKVKIANHTKNVSQQLLQMRHLIPLSDKTILEIKRDTADLVQTNHNSTQESHFSAGQLIGQVKLRKKNKLTHEIEKRLSLKLLNLDTIVELEPQKRAKEASSAMIKVLSNVQKTHMQIQVIKPKMEKRVIRDALRTLQGRAHSESDGQISGTYIKSATHISSGQLLDGAQTDELSVEAEILDQLFAQIESSNSAKILAAEKSQKDERVGIDSTQAHE